MANYATLKAAIAAVIKQNGNNEITGNLLQQSLMSMIDSLTVGYQFVGFCSQNTDPGTPDQKVFYLARSKGIYNNFGGVTIEKNGIYMFRWTTEWTFTVLAQFDNAVNTNSDWLTLASACATAILASKADLYSKGVESLPEFNGWMSSAGAYQASNAQYLLVPISPGEKIRFVNVNANATIYCFLKGYDKLSASGELFDICNGKSRVTLASNEDSGELTAPDDVFCVLVGRRYDGNRRLPNIFINGMNVNDVVSASKTIVTDDVEITAEYGATSGGGQILANFTGGYLTTPNYIRCNATINGGLSVNCPDYEFNIFAFDTDKNIISNTGWNVSNTYVSIPDGTKYIKINFRNQQLAQLPMEKEITIVGLSRISGEQIEEYNDNKPNAGEVAINAPVGLQISNPLANEGTAQTLQDDDNTIYINHGVLRLPTNYKETGAPTKLIVFCHGWSEHYNASSYQIATTSSANIAYLLKEGFAVFDMDGNVKSTSIGHGCSDMAVECYMAGLKWVFRRFNLDRRIYLAGHSQGGMMALLLSRIGSLSVRACCVVSPANSVINLMELFSGETAADVKTAMVQYYGMTGTPPVWSTSRGAISNDEKAFFFANFGKIAKSSSLWGDVCDVSVESISAFDNVFCDIANPSSAEQYYYQTKHKIIKVPTKIINGGADASCNTGWNRLISQMAQNAGGNMDFRVITGADHGTVMTVGNNTITTIFGETVTGVPTAMAEIVKFLRRF